MATEDVWAQAQHAYSELHKQETAKAPSVGAPLGGDDHADGSGTAVDMTSAETFDKHVADYVFALWRESDEFMPSERPRTEPCGIGAQCVSRSVAVQLFLNMRTNKLHACCSFCPQWQRHSRQEWQRAEHLCPDSRLSGCVYACLTHNRVHACGPWCTLGYVDHNHFTTCWLSKQTMSAALIVQYDDLATDGIGDNAGAGKESSALPDDLQGDDDVSTSATLDNDGAASTTGNGHTNGRARAGAKRRRTPAQRQTSNFARDQSGVVNGLAHIRDMYIPTVQRPPAFPEEPRLSLFQVPEVASFDTTPERLAVEYHTAFCVVEQLLFSQERASFEYDVRKRAHEAAYHSFVAREDQLGDPTAPDSPHFWSMDAAMQTVAGQLARFRLYPQLLLPHGTLRRLNAYYALLCIEFRQQLLRHVDEMVHVVEPRMQRKFHRVQLCDFRWLVPVILELFQTDLKQGDTTYAPADWLLHMFFPESKGRYALLGPAQTRTQMRKDIKQVLASILGHPDTVRRQELLQSTTLDYKFLLGSDEPVVRTFLRARLARLRIKQT